VFSTFLQDIFLEIASFAVGSDNVAGMFFLADIKSFQNVGMIDS
jgi:hypothetical protein